MRTLRANLLLLLTAVIWGAAFVAQSIGADQVEPFGFLAIRSYLGALVLLPLVLLRRRTLRRLGQPRPPWRPLLLAGGCCGAALCAASAAQQMGITMDASTSKAGFLTALYVPLVPLLSLVFLRRRVGMQVWLGVALSIAGLLLLTGASGGLSAGEGLLLLCALLYAVQILMVGHFVQQVDAVELSLMQFAVCAVLSTAAALLLEHNSWQNIWAARWSLLYAGCLSSGVGYTLQAAAQRDTSPTVASLLMSLESVFSCLFGWIILHDTLSGWELLGCGLMFGAVILSQLPSRRAGAGPEH